MLTEISKAFKNIQGKRRWKGENNCDHNTIPCETIAAFPRRNFLLIAMLG